MAEAKPKTSPKAIKFLFGGLAGMGATVFVQPLDLVKNRMQLSGQGSKAREYKTSFHALVSILKNEGFGGIYTGLSAGLLRQATYTTTRLGIYTILFEKMTGSDGRPKGKKAAATKAAPPTSPSVSSDPSKVIGNKPVDAAAQDNTPLVETTQQASPVSSTDTSPLTTTPTVQPSLDLNARWSFLLSKHPLNHVHKSIAKLTPAYPLTQTKPTPNTHSTPNPVRRHQTPVGLFSKPQLRTEESEGLPPKAAEMYGAFSAKSSNTTSQLLSPALPNGKSKFFQPIISDHQKPLTNTTAMSVTSLPAPEVKRPLDISSSKKQISQTSKLPPGLSDTEALRYRLIKKLKAKKKKLAKLNELLGQQGGSNLRPDSTDLGSPNTVTSSTYDGSNCDEFLSDLLSPATTASNLSPDSTGFLEMLTNGQDGVDRLDSGVYAAGEVSQTNTVINGPNTENFLDEFLSQAAAQRPTEMETEALGALELFMM